MAQETPRVDQSIERNYDVGVSHLKPARKKVAVFVTHGMGQPIPFQTLDQVAEALRKLDDAEGHHNPNPVSTTIKSGDATTVKPDDVWLQRVELRLKDGDACVDAHIYEGYWAPITEGRITVRNVFGFLAGAGRNGLKNSRGIFKRWLFSRYEGFPTLIRTVLYLLIALGAVTALFVMNATVALVGTGSGILLKRPDWLTVNLLADLTTVFNAVVTTLLIFGISLGVAAGMRQASFPKRIRMIWSWTTLPLFVVAFTAVILGGLSIVLLFYGHARGMAGAEPIWYQIFNNGVVDGFNKGFDSVAWRLWVYGFWGIILWWAAKIVIGIDRDTRARARGQWLTILISLVFAAVAAVTFKLFWTFFVIFQEHFGASTITATQRGLAWPLLVILSAYIRQILVQYVGDVAIYVMPYKLDAFNDLRKEIRETVYKVAHAVYALKNSSGEHEYEHVILVGHSLGSVISYDILNRLIHEDRVTGNSIDAVNRTPLFLTFGSPLDKTAFIFSIQGHGTSEARESLAASVQPLIQDYKYRPEKWINIYSPWDIISGSLDLYDPREGNDPKRVDNKRDPEATTFLAAHTEYWNNKLVVRTIYDAL